MGDQHNLSLQCYPLFAGLSEAELAQILPCLTKRVFGKGAYLFHPGNTAINSYLIESGLVRLFFYDIRGREYLVDLLGPQSIVGMPLMSPEQSRELGAAVVQTTTVFVISQKDLAFFVQRFPQISRNIYHFLILQLRSLMQAFKASTVLNTTGRLASRILHLSYLGSAEKFQNEFELPLSQGELASALGASRGHLNRALLRLQKAGLIQIQGQKLTILDRRGLLQLTEGIFTE